MNGPGTIGRPAAHGPRQLTRMTTENTLPAAAEAPAPAAARSHRLQNRTTRMHLMTEALARSHREERLRRAETQRVARNLALARRWERRSRRLRRHAERASQRARRALAQAVMQ